MAMTETLAVAIEVMRDLCADNSEALWHLDAVAEALGLQPETPLVPSPAAERQKLAAWNAWAAQ